MRGRARHGLIWLAALALLLSCSPSRELATGPAWPPPPAEPEVVFQRSIYGSQSLERSFGARLKDFIFGRSPDQVLAKPYGLACSGEEQLYVVDTARKGVLVMDLRSGAVRGIHSLGERGNLVEPVSLALDGLGRLYVADTRLAKIAVFDADDRFLRFIGEGELAAPVGLAFDAGFERLYVVDTQLHVVKIFDTAGALLGSFGGRGDERGKFHHPLGIAVSPADTVYVVDTFHFAIQAFSPDGEYLFSFGPAADGVGALARPRDIALDGSGRLYVSDALRHNVQVFAADGEPLLSFGSIGTRAGQFRLPAGLCLGGGNRLYVVDSINGRVQEFLLRSPGEPGDRS